MKAREECRSLRRRLPQSSAAVSSICLNRPESGGTVTLYPLQSSRPANKPLFNAHARYLQTVALHAAQRRDVAPGTHDPDPPAKKSVSTSVKGVCFVEQKGAG